MGCVRWVDQSSKETSSKKPTKLYLVSKSWRHQDVFYWQKTPKCWIFSLMWLKTSYQLISPILLWLDHRDQQITKDFAYEGVSFSIVILIMNYVTITKYHLCLYFYFKINQFISWLIVFIWFKEQCLNTNFHNHSFGM